MRILIVEDDKNRLRTIETTVKQLGNYQYDVAMFANDAYELQKEHLYSLIILGISFAWKIGENTHNRWQGEALFLLIQTYCTKTEQEVPGFIVFSEKTIETRIPFFIQANNRRSLQISIRKFFSEKKSNKNILVVEDSISKQRVIKKILEELNIVRYSITDCAVDAKNVCLKKFDIDIIILDMNFPWFQHDNVEPNAGIKLWFDLIHEYKSRKKKMPKIIVYSNNAFLEKKLKSMEEPIPSEFVAQIAFPEALRAKLLEII